MTTLKPQQRSTHVLEHAQTHHGIPLHTKDARNSTSDSARNSRVRHPARPSKCTISSTVRAWSGTSTSTPTETLRMRASNTPAKASWNSFALKRSSHRQHLPDNARNFRGRAKTDRSPIQMRYLARYMGPRSGALSTHTTAETPRARAFNTQRRITGSLCTQKVCARNMRHLRTLARATSNLSSIKMHHTERHTGREWRIHPAHTHMHRDTPHAYFDPIQTPP